MGVFLLIGIASIMIGIFSFTTSDLYGSGAYILAGFFLALVENIGVTNLVIFNPYETSITKIIIAWLSFLGFIILFSIKIWKSMYR
jgi:hypothetical protein